MSTYLMAKMHFFNGGKCTSFMDAMRILMVVDEHFNGYNGIFGGFQILFNGFKIPSQPTKTWLLTRNR